MASGDPSALPLFAHDRRRKPSAPKDPAVGKALQHLMFRMYVSTYQKNFGEKPHVGGMEWGILKTLLSANGPMPDLTLEQRAETTGRRLLIYLNWTDPWVRSKGHTLAIFRKLWNQLRVMDETQHGARVNGRLPGCLHHPPCQDGAEHTTRNVETWRSGSSSPF